MCLLIAKIYLSVLLYKHFYLNYFVPWYVTFQNVTVFTFTAKIPNLTLAYTRVGTLIVASIYLQLIQNRYMFRSFTVLQCSHQHCVQPVASYVEVVGYL